MPPDLPSPSFGPFVILQFAGAIVVLGGLALAVYRGTRDRRTAMSQPQPFPQETRWFFDGPLNAALDLLRDVRDSMRRSESHVEPLGEQLRIMNRALDEINRKLDDLKDLKRRR